MTKQVVNGVLLDERVQLSLLDLCRACSRHGEWVVQLVEEGILDPKGDEPREWRFSADSLNRAYKAMRLQRDLELNLAGVALVLDLMDQLDYLQNRLQRFEQPLSSGI